LIETMRADSSGTIGLLSNHLQRLRQSAAALGFAYPGDEIVSASLSRRLTDNTHRHHPEPHEHRVRLLLAANGELDITVAKLEPLQTNPRIAVSNICLPSDNPWLQHKTTFRPWYAAAMNWLTQHPGMFDLIYLNEKSQLCEGSRSNIYLLFEQQWLTPPLPSGLLGGVQRLDLLQRGLVREAVLSKTDLLSATQWRLSNALRGWFDVQLDLTVSD
jgi:4-amino-4-deoxychorismate lyase